MLSPMGRGAWWAILILNAIQLVNFTINGTDAKWQVWLSGISALYALWTLRRDAIAEERFLQEKPKLEQKR